jgi:uncharacterized protein (TIGR00369 family)
VYLEKVRDGALAPPPFAALVGLRLVEVDDGRVVFEATPNPSLYNPLGLAHGGFIATILDSALGCSVTTRMPPGKVAVSQDLNVRYFRSVTADTGIIRCEGKVLNIGRTTATAEAALYGPDGKLHAHATSTLALVEPRRD